MSTRPVPETTADFPSRPSHRADSPELYESWREYAFSRAPELETDDHVSPAPSSGVQSV